MKMLIRPTAGVALGLSALFLTQNLVQAEPTDKELVHQIFDTMVQVHGVTPGFRLVHAKGIVCEGSFMPLKIAAGISKAAHFQKGPVPVTVRFSDGAADPTTPDNSPNAGPRGMAIRFKIPGGDDTDIVAMSHNGFVVGTPAEFLALQKSVVATDPSKPHPWPVEEFLGAHPTALKFVKDNAVASASFATQEFFSNDSFVFVNKDGKKQTGRYKIIPIDGQHNLTEAEAKTKSPDYLAEDLKTRVAAKPLKYRLFVQFPNAGDSTKDPSVVWPDDRKTVQIGVITISSVNSDSTTAEKALAFTPGNLTDGIDFSDDPFPELRTAVYSLSVKHRHQKQ